MFRIRLAAALVVAALILHALPAVAQTPAVEPGVRVRGRVAADQRMFTGTFVSMSNDTLSIDGAFRNDSTITRLALWRGDLHSYDVFAGRRNYSGYGAVIGAIGGAVIGYPGGDCSEGAGSSLGSPPAPCRLYAGAIGLFAGALAGWFMRSDRWKTVWRRDR